MLDESSNFSNLYSGSIPAYVVAVKTVEAGLEDDDANKSELCKEAQLMSQVTGHQNLVSIIGVVTRGMPAMPGWRR